MDLANILEKTALGTTVELEQTKIYLEQTAIHDFVSLF